MIHDALSMDNHSSLLHTYYGSLALVVDGMPVSDTEHTLTVSAHERNELSAPAVSVRTSVCLAPLSSHHKISTATDEVFFHLIIC